jgi:hypothetical protein
MEDKVVKIGLDNIPFPQYWDDTLGDYTTVKGKDGAPFSYIKGSSIMLPVEPSSFKKYRIEDVDVTLAANESYTFPQFDISGLKAVQGEIVTGEIGTLSILESHDQVLWTVTNQVEVEPSTATTVNGVSYDRGSIVTFNVYKEFMKLVFTNKGSLQTRCLINLYATV